VSVQKLAKAMELQQVAPSVVCRGAPEGEAIGQSRALGKTLAEHIVG